MSLHSGSSIDPTPKRESRWYLHTMCFLSTQLFIVWPLEMQMGFLQLQPFIILWSEEDMYKANSPNIHTPMIEWWLSCKLDNYCFSSICKNLGNVGIFCSNCLTKLMFWCQLSHSVWKSSKMLYNETSACCENTNDFRTHPLT